MATDVLEPQARNAKSVPGYLPVPVKSLLLVNACGLNLYALGEGAATPSLYRDSEFEVRAVDFQRLLARGTHTLYVKSAEYGNYQKLVRQGLEKLVDDDSASPTDRFSVIQTAVAAEVQQAFNMIDAGKAVEKSQEVGRHLARSLSMEKTVPQDLFRVMRHDFYTFTHIINVSSYCVLLAQYLGISDSDQLEEIATGGMLHDIGKRRVPAAILNKNGRPDDREWEIIRAHPRTGYEDLVGRTDVTFPQLMMVYQHHEKLDGTGYPVGVTMEDIHPWARMCAVVDVFDAMTGDRPYRKPMRVSDVLEYLEKIAGTHLDQEMVECWVAAMRNR